ncbi:MAG: bifunctional nuclease family protein [Aggregatilineales bacterium]
MSQHRIIVLKDAKTDRYLPIWIGPCEADAITVTLQETEMARPLTHDLLKSTITQMGGELLHVIIHALQNDTFFAKLVVRQGARQIEIDARSSDAIALAVRVHVPIYVDESVLDQAATTPDEEVQNETAQGASEPSEDRLSVFKDYIDSLNLDDLDDSE